MRVGWGFISVDVLNETQNEILKEAVGREKESRLYCAMSGNIPTTINNRAVNDLINACVG